jgi:hypothetical protein
VLAHQYGGISLSAALKADGPGNLFKSGSDALSTHLKEDSVGNFLKYITVPGADTDSNAAEDGGLQRSASSPSSAAEEGDQTSQPPLSAFDPEPWNDQLPHGHVEEEHTMMQHSDMDMVGGLSRALVVGNTCNGGDGSTAAVTGGISGTSSAGTGGDGETGAESSSSGGTAAPPPDGNINLTGAAAAVCPFAASTLVVALAALIGIRAV